MAVSISSLNSGSNGNCYYIGNSREAILIDAGISCKEVEKRMARLGLPLRNIQAIFISHEHSDHISGLQTLSGKLCVPVYITANTLCRSGLQLDGQLVRTFHPYRPVQIGSLKITPFPKLHDACDPHSFLVETAGIKVGVFTDIGAACENLVLHFRECNAAFLEANYDDDMLDRGRYPYFLKNRIRGGKGHLSNAQALDIFRKHKPEFMSHLILSHLSKDNNCPELVKELFRLHAGSTEVIVASRFCETDIYEIGRNFGLPQIAERVEYRHVQYSLF